jgi:hypothetical protein
MLRCRRVRLVGKRDTAMLAALSQSHKDRAIPRAKVLIRYREKHPCPNRDQLQKRRTL